MTRKYYDDEEHGGLVIEVVNQARPKCPVCGGAFEPVFQRRVRGASVVRLRNVWGHVSCRRVAVKSGAVLRILSA